jgi:hypothetical protein
LGSLIRALRAYDAEAYAALRRQALLEAPLAFGASPADDFAASPESVREQLRRAPAWVILGAFRPALIGTVGSSAGSLATATAAPHMAKASWLIGSFGALQQSRRILRYDKG